MKVRTSRRRRSGYTLIELSLVMMAGLAIGGMIMTLMSQQIAFLRILSAQNFLSEEAPVISMYVSRLVGKADRFRLHANLNDALAGQNATLGASPVLVLNFNQPDGTTRASILSFENRGGGAALYYYIVPEEGALGEPEWAVTRQAAGVSFFVQAGILRMNITGRNGELITYSGSMQQ